MNEHTPPRERDASRAVPEAYYVVVPDSRDTDSVFDLAAFAGALVRTWKLVVPLVIVGAAAGFGASLLVADGFRARAVVAPVAQTSAGSSLRSQFGGVAALAGIEIGAKGDRKEQAFATLASDSLAREFIQARQLVPLLYPERWDAAAKTWRAGEREPSLEMAVRKFVEHVRKVEEDRKTGLVTVSVDWTSPQLAAEWANGLIEAANERLRNEAIVSAKRSIEYLRNELPGTSVLGVQQAIYRLIEEQVNNAMLANVQHEFAFQFIDRAVPPPVRISPKPIAFLAAGGVMGFLIAVAAVLWRTRRRIG